MDTGFLLDGTSRVLAVRAKIIERCDRVLKGFAAFSGGRWRLAPLWGALGCTVREGVACSTPSPENRDGDNDGGHDHNHKHLFYTDEHGRHHNFVSRFGPPAYARLVVSKRLSFRWNFYRYFQQNASKYFPLPVGGISRIQLPTCNFAHSLPAIRQKGDGVFCDSQ